MALTDYISPTVLADAGYIHESQSAVMLEHIDRQYMTEQGWVNLSRVRNVPVSVSKAAEIIGVSPATLEGYVKLGYIAKDCYGKISLLSALGFNYDAVKKDYLSSKRDGRI